MDWAVVTNNINILLEGALLTLKISAYALVFSIPIGIVIGLFRVSNNKILSLPATWYIEFVRGVPLLVLLIWIYFVLGKYFNLGSYISAILGLAIFSGAFVAEIVRAGISSSAWSNGGRSLLRHDIFTGNEISYFTSSVTDGFTANGITVHYSY